ncbi:unnamed protein product [Toxocara canis]|uniref:RRM domain-containing protein n=1 Tax=Toxocara canis TaxID=6265 RepID=A0A183U9R8_TOXCA|nr:unnamed protein product [Toxocara canis]
MVCLREYWKELGYKSYKGALDNRPRVVAVRGFKVEQENDVIVHMEHFGELVDMDFAAGGRSKPVTAYFTYKTRRDAEQVCYHSLFFVALSSYIIVA